MPGNGGSLKAGRKNSAERSRLTSGASEEYLLTRFTEPNEIFNANSAILNSLLTALNEKIFRRGKEFKLPALMFVGTSNVLPEDEALSSLFDSFPVRVKSDKVDPDLLIGVRFSFLKV